MGLPKNRFCWKREKKVIKRPQLLVKNHNKPDLQLWYCQGCPNVIFRVEIPFNETKRRQSHVSPNKQNGLDDA